MRSVPRVLLLLLCCLPRLTAAEGETIVVRTDADMRLVPASARYLHIVGYRVSDLSPISQLTDLMQLNLEAVVLDAKASAHVGACAALRVLRMESCAIADGAKSSRALARLTRLETLFLWQPRLPSEDAYNWIAVLPALRDVSVMLGYDKSSHLDIAPLYTPIGLSRSVVSVVSSFHSNIVQPAAALLSCSRSICKLSIILPESFMIPIGPDVITALGCIPSLRDLNLLGGSLSADGLAAMHVLSHIERLEFRGACPEALDFTAFRSLSRLRMLDVSNSAMVTDSCAIAISSLPLVEHVSMRGGARHSLTDSGVGALLQLPHLKYLDISYNWGFAGRSLDGMRPSARLHTLYALGCKAMTSEAARCLFQTSRLEVLGITGCPLIPESDLIALCRGNPLRWLAARRMPGITDAVLQALGARTHMDYVDISGCGAVTQAGVSALLSRVSVDRLVTSSVWVFEWGARTDPLARNVRMLHITRLRSAVIVDERSPALSMLRQVRLSRASSACARLVLSSCVKSCRISRIDVDADIWQEDWLTTLRAEYPDIKWVSQ